MSDVRLDGKVAVITGATGGWGSGTAVAMAKRGASVVLNARTQSKLDALADRLNQQGAKAVGVAQDSRTFEGASILIERAVEAFGRVDIVMNAAGVTLADPSAKQGESAPGSMPMYGGSIFDLTEEAWSYVISAELTAVFNCTKAAAQQMVAQGDGGSITTVVGTIVGAGGQSAHAAAKGGVLNGIWSWSDELKPHGINVNGVRGYVRSILTDVNFDVETFDYEPTTDAQLPTEPIDAGELVAWLASSEGRDVTGAYLGIDGPRVTIWEPKLPDTAVFQYPRWTVEELERTLGPIVRRRPPRVSMTEIMKDMFSVSDKERLARAMKAKGN